MKITVFYEHVREACRQTGKSLEEVAELITAQGISGIEMDYYELVNEEDAFFERLAACGIPIHSVYVMFDWGNHPFDMSYRRILRSLSEHGIKHVLAIPGLVEQGQDRKRYRERMCKKLRRMCRYAQNRGIQVYMEDFDDERAVFAKGEEVKWFLDRIPLLKCAFDTGNFIYSGEDAIKVLPLLIDRIGYVHCKDRSLIKKEGETPKETVTGEKLYSAGVGSGIIPMKELLERLTAYGYKGCFAIEHFGSQDQLEDMCSSAKWLRAQLKDIDMKGKE